MATMRAHGTTRCQRHAGVATELRCDACGQPYCRECWAAGFIHDYDTPRLGSRP